MLYLAYRSISLFFFIYRQGRNHVGDGEFRPIPSLCHSAGDLQIRHNFNLIQSEEINWIYFIQFNKDGTQKQIILYYYWPLNKRINTYISIWKKLLLTDPLPCSSMFGWRWRIPSIAAARRLERTHTGDFTFRCIFLIN